MAVKTSRSASRVLAVFEKIALVQPVGVSDLARLLGDDKSAVQRAIMTLAESGWICPASDTPKRWKISLHILRMARAAYEDNELLARARVVMERLSKESGEAVMLTVPDVKNFLVVAVVQSPQLLRMVPNVGMVVPVRGSATSKVILAHMGREEQEDYLGETADAELTGVLEQSLRDGYAVSEGEVYPEATSIAAPVFDFDGAPMAAIAITAPKTRFSAKDHRRVGEMVKEAGLSISRGMPSQVRGG